MSFSRIFLLIICSFLIVGCSSSAEEQLIIKDTLEEFDISSFPFEKVSLEEQEVLNEVLNVIYKTRETYVQVVNIYGNVKPFSDIVFAKEDQVMKLLKLYERYDLPLPPNRWKDNGEQFSSLIAACDVAFDLEKEIIIVVNKGFSISNNQDFRAVFSSFERSSSKQHKLAFSKCGDNS